MKILFVLIAICMLSCAKGGIDANVTQSTGSFDVQFLFEIDGVKIYRFMDAGRYRYVATGNGNVYSIINNGKTQYNDGVIK